MAGILHPDKYLSMIIDGADQARYGKVNFWFLIIFYCLLIHSSVLFNRVLIIFPLLSLLSGLPYFHIASKESSEAYKMKTKLVGAIIHGHFAGVFTHLEDLKQGANITIEVAHRMLTAYAKSGKLRICALL